MRNLICLLAILFCLTVAFGCGEKKTETTGETPLMNAGQPKQEEEIVVDISDSEKDPVLIATVTAQKEQEKAVEKKEEEAKAEEKPVDKVEKTGDESLIAEIKANNVDAVLSMIDKGADVNAKSNDEHEFSPMMYAAGMGNKQIVEALVDNKADVNAVSAGGQTALVWAARGNNPEVVDYLLKNGADPSIKDMGGHTALDWAKLGKNNEEVRSLLEEAMKKD